METGNEPPVPADPPEDTGQDNTPAREDNWHRTRDSRGHFIRDMDSVRRDAQAAELRSQGLPFQQIANQLGYSDRGDAWRGVQRAKDDVVRPAVAKLIAK